LSQPSGVRVLVGVCVVPARVQGSLAGNAASSPRSPSRMPRIRVTPLRASCASDISAARILSQFRHIVAPILVQLIDSHWCSTPCTHRDAACAPIQIFGAGLPLQIELAALPTGPRQCADGADSCGSVCASCGPIIITASSEIRRSATTWPPRRRTTLSAVNRQASSTFASLYSHAKKQTCHKGIMHC
jgi:hypothetical protein